VSPMLTRLLPGALAAAALLSLASGGTAQEPALAEWLQRAARSGGTVEIRRSPPRGFTAEVRIPKGKQLTLRALGPVTFDGGGMQEIGLRVQSGGRVVVEGPIHWTGYTKNAIRCTLAEGLTIRGGTITGTGQSGLLTGRTHAVRLEGLTSTGTGGHGVYISEGGNGHVVTGCTLTGNAKAGLQINAVRYRSRKVLVKGNDCRGNGNAGIQLAAVSDAVVSGNDVSGSRQGVVCWDDGQGRRFRCERVDLRQQAGPFNVARNSIGILLPGTRRLAN
jgi:parallel beta-helix repeat protein